MYEYAVRCIRAIDGDTVEAEIDLGFRILYRTAIRLGGIAANELHRGTPEERALGEQAKARVGELIRLSPTGTVRTKLHPFEKYGRVLGEITLGGLALSRTLVEEGLAKEV